MEMYSLDAIYADPGVRSIRRYTEEHRALVCQVLETDETIHAYWWDRDITGLVLFTDRRIVQALRYSERAGLFGVNYRFATRLYPYATISRVETFAGGLLELPRLILRRHDAEDALIVLNGANREKLEALAGQLRRLITAWKKAPPGQPPEDHPTMTDTTTRLRQLYDLYQSGVLTEDQYRQAKARLMAD
ncbi:MAG: hypothetical protein Kow0077_21680 [Anaerolineae bacterium]